MPYRLRPDSWQPARWLGVDHVVLMVGLLFIGYLRGLDYLIGDDTWNSRDFMLAAAPEWVWGGVGFLTGAAILTFAITTRRHLFVYVGHWWLGIAYGLNALAAVLAAGPSYAVPIVALGAAWLVACTLLAHRLAQAGRRLLSFAAVLAGVGAVAAGMYYGPSFDGIRGGGSVGLVAGIHVLQAFRTGARPIRPTRPADEAITTGGA